MAAIDGDLSQVVDVAARKRHVGGEGALRHGRSRMDSQRALPAALAVTLTAVSCIGRETQAGIR
jgi:hypothetical protein